MMKEPTLSMIIPVYNGERYLAEAVNSILKQPCEDYEIIIIDDGSKDSSGIIADQFAEASEKIRVFHISNSGVSAARNRGIQEARGRYIGFLDADDVLCKNVYTEEINKLLKTEKNDILGFSYIVGTNNLKHGRIEWAKEGQFLRGDKNYYAQTWRHFCAYIYHKKLFTDTVCFPDGIGYQEDAVFMHLAASTILSREQPWFVYRRNQNSAMHRLDNFANSFLVRVDAWSWCRERCTNSVDQAVCDGKIFECTMEYIKRSCYLGMSIREIMQKVEDNHPFQQARNSRFWVRKDIKQIYTEFFQDPRKFWVKARLQGVAFVAARMASHTTVGSKIYEIYRFKENIESYL